MVLFGIMDYLMKKYHYEAFTLILAYVLGPPLERALRVAPTIFSAGEDAGSRATVNNR